MHLQKLSVGSTAIDSLQDWQNSVVARRVKKGESPHHVHVTRMFPKQRDALLDGGSLYWVIKGQMICRNRIVDLQEVRRKDGVKACAIIMDPELVPVRPVPRRAFQGWRYLKPEDAPGDLTALGGGSELPETLRRKLSELGAW